MKFKWRNDTYITLYKHPEKEKDTAPKKTFKKKWNANVFAISAAIL